LKLRIKAELKLKPEVISSSFWILDFDFDFVSQAPLIMQWDTPGLFSFAALSRNIEKYQCMFFSTAWPSCFGRTMPMARMLVLVIPLLSCWLCCVVCLLDPGVEKQA